jgi:hypothetical protein
VLSKTATIVMEKKRINMVNLFQQLIWMPYFFNLSPLLQLELQVNDSISTIETGFALNVPNVTDGSVALNAPVVTTDPLIH